MWFPIFTQSKPDSSPWFTGPLLSSPPLCTPCHFLDFSNISCFLSLQGLQTLPFPYVLSPPTVLWNHQPSLEDTSSKKSLPPLTPKSGPFLGHQQCPVLPHPNTARTLSELCIQVSLLKGVHVMRQRSCLHDSSVLLRGLTWELSFSGIILSIASNMPS